MNSQNQKTRDAFAFSEGGIKIRSSYAHVPQIPDDRINARLTERLRAPPEDQPDTAEELRSFWERLWSLAFRRAA